MNPKVSIPDCDTCETRRCSIFDELSLEDQGAISANKGGNVFKKGQNIFYEGTRPSGLYCIHSGKVKVYKINSYGKEQIVRLARGGDILGYRALLSGELYSSFAASMEDSLICYIPKEVYFDLVSSNTDLAMKMMKLLSHDLKVAENHVAYMAQKSVRERLAEALLMLKEYYGLESDGETLDITITREDLANLVGTATETVIRFLSEFKHDQMIELKGRRIKILNTAALVKTGKIDD